MLGSFFGIFKSYSEKQIRYLLLFAAGVMTAVSVFQLLPQSLKLQNSRIAIMGLVAGGFLMYLFNILLPHYHHLKASGLPEVGDLKRMATFLFIGISLHNLPEGFAIGVGAMSNLSFSLLIALAISLHDIPEAICIAAPYYYNTKNRFKAFFLTLLTFIPTMAGFLISYSIMKNISDFWLALFISFTAGIMLYISMFEIIPRSATNKNMEKKKMFLSLTMGITFVLLLQQLITLLGIYK